MATRPPRRASPPSKRAPRSSPRLKPAGSTSRKSQPAGSSLAVPRWVETVLAQALKRGERKAAMLSAAFPEESPRKLGERLVRTSAFRAGLAGAVTGTLAIVTLPVGLPAGVALTLLLEAELLFALMALYGLSGEGEKGRLRLAALWAGAGFADAAKSAGLKIGAEAFARAIAGSLPARIIARLNPILLRAILRRLGLGWIPKAARLWPLLGAPVAFAMDRAALRALGSAALSTLDGVAHDKRRAAAAAPARSRR
jgi:hypothetical protein